MFERNTYIVLDLPEPINSIIHKIRIDQKDEYRASLPNEITLTGSNGVGPIAEDQSPEELFSMLNEIAKATKPITVQFDKPYRFPGTDIVVMKLVDDLEIRNLHRRLVDSGIKFRTIEFPFEPHCTLRSFSPLTDEDFSKLMKTTISDSFTLDSISVYSMPAPMILRFTAKLSGQ